MQVADESYGGDGGGRERRTERWAEIVVEEVAGDGRRRR